MGGHFNMRKRMNRTAIGALVTAVSLPSLYGLFHLVPGFEVHLLCRPSAFLASLYWGVPLHFTGSGYLLPLSFPIEVTTACSGAGFLALFISVLLGLGVERGLSARGFSLLVPLACLLGLVANAFRVITTWYVDQAAEFLLPASLHAGVHAMTGAFVFLSALAAAYLVTWRQTREA